MLSVTSYCVCRAITHSIIVDLGVKSKSWFAVTTANNDRENQQSQEASSHLLHQPKNYALSSTLHRYIQSCIDSAEDADPDRKIKTTCLYAHAYPTQMSHDGLVSGIFRSIDHYLLRLNHVYNTTYVRKTRFFCVLGARVTGYEGDSAAR